MKKLLSILLCLSLVLSLGVLPAIAAEDDSSAVGEAAETIPEEDQPEAPAPEEAPAAGEEDAPAADGGDAENVYYYYVRTGADAAVELMKKESVEVGGHPSYNPTWDGMVYTWYLNADLSGSPVDPSSYTIKSTSDKLTFYGYLDSVSITMHMPAGSSVDSFGQQYVNRGGYFNPNHEFTVLPDGYWAAGWTDAAGNLFDAENTPVTQDIDLYALTGAFRVTYMADGRKVGGEGFLSAGTPKHAPTSCLMVGSSGQNGLDQRQYDIIGWKDENGSAVDINTVIITEDRTLYAVLDIPAPLTDPDEAPETDWGFDWRVEDGELFIGGLETLSPVAAQPDGSWTTPWSGNASHIHCVVFANGVKEIKSGFLRDLPNVERIELPITIERVGHDIFLSSPNLAEVIVWGPEGYELSGWCDGNGNVFELAEICSGTEFYGDLSPAWIRAWVEGRFTDVSETSWYHDAVQFCYQAMIMNGISDTAFSPNGTATRAQVVTVLWRLAGEPEGGGSSFSDVSAGKYFSDAVAWAAANGITNGYTDGTFRPNNAVTRQEFLTFLYRFTQYWAEPNEDYEGDPVSDFADKASIGSWALPAERWSTACGLQVGVQNSDGTYSLNPTQTIKRSEMATFLMRYCYSIVYGESDAVS